MKRHYSFIISVVGIFGILFIGIFIRGIKTESIVENKRLYTFPKFTFESFMKNSFQNDLEEALSDQIVLGETFKSKYLELKQQSLSLMVFSIKRERADNIISETDQLETRNNNEEPTTAVGSNVVEATGETKLSEDGPNESIESSTGEAVTFVPHVEKIDSYTKDYMSKLNWSPIDETHFEISLNPKGSGLVEVVGEHHLIFTKIGLSAAKAGLENKAANINQLAKEYPNIQFNSFYIETDVDVDFVGGKITHDLSNYLGNQFNDNVKFSSLNINSVEEYINGFYKTDHHWDTERQQIGYQALIKFLIGPNEPLADFDLYLTNLAYNGYKSRLLNEFTTTDVFKFIVPKVSRSDVYINGEKSTYGNKYGFIKGDFTQETAENYYGDCNGADYALVEFHYNQPSKPNAVIFIDSFSNPLKEVIASHYNKTYYVDLRYYETAYGKPFDFSEFIKDKNIGVVVNLGYYYFFAGDTFIIND
ncbi:hypothetical protein [Fusibacter bizertensis]